MRKHDIAISRPAQRGYPEYDIVKVSFAALMPQGEAAIVLGGIIGATKADTTKTKRRR
jgi:hypothetical protein